MRERENRRQEKNPWKNRGRRRIIRDVFLTENTRKKMHVEKYRKAQEKDEKPAEIIFVSNMARYKKRHNNSELSIALGRKGNKGLATFIKKD
jgi:hypothetical protein